MNLVLLRPEDFLPGDVRVRLHGRRRDHVLDVHRAQVGETLRVGVLGDRIGTGRITRLDAEALEMDVVLEGPPPPPVPVTLVLGLPRPLMLKRVLASAAAFGVKRIALLHCRRVEKSFWSSSALREDALREALLRGLEQARDTVLPELSVHHRFRPFAEDDLPALAAGTRGLVAHPESSEPCPRGVEGPITLAIGPEGGFVDYEVERLHRAGLQPVHCGERILRVETAVPALLGRLC